MLAQKRNNDFTAKPALGYDRGTQRAQRKKEKKREHESFDRPFDKLKASSEQVYTKRGVGQDRSKDFTAKMRRHQDKKKREHKLHEFCELHEQNRNEKMGSVPIFCF